MLVRTCIAAPWQSLVHPATSAAPTLRHFAARACLSAPSVLLRHSFSPARHTNHRARPWSHLPRTMVTVAPASWTPPAPGSVPAPPRPEPHDIHTLSNIKQCRISHVHLDWSIDWDRKIISGSVTHKIVVLGSTQELVLDTSYLDIRTVSVDGKHVKDFDLGPRQGSLGSALHIPIRSRRKGDTLEVQIEYATTKDCTALGWLTAEQTQGKKFPFLYSQCQAIHCRSLVPIMDSPAHKITYTSVVRSPIQVLMSALPEGSIRGEDDAKAPIAEVEKGVYRFRQAVGIPSYLIAIVGGDLEFRALAPRIGIYAEPPMADKAQWEFKEDANRFLMAAEETISPYSWQRYDSVVLPPSFPYGGMENANLTTLTPALVCGDRSQTDVLLHELMHSWSGNLTSCANWESFWLNEGINVWLERLLLQVVHGGGDNGAAFRGLGYIQGAKALTDALLQFKDNPRFQRLVPVFKDGEDPDDAFSSIPYEKGSNFVLYLERTVGGLEVFLPFIRSWFKTFYDRSVTTEEFRQHLSDYYAGNKEISEKLKKVDWDAWLHGEGLELPVQLEYDDTLVLQAFALAKRWQDVVKSSKRPHGFGKQDIQGWNSIQVVVFLEQLHMGPPVPAAIVDELDKIYEFSKATNGEILLPFFLLALEDKEGKYKKQAAAWVQTVGRMKYCRPVYRSIYEVDKELARSTFTKAKSFYHPIAAAMIQKDLGLGTPCGGQGTDLRSGQVGRGGDIGSSGCVVAVIGSTGTGKSQLAVEIAQAVREGLARSDDRRGGGGSGDEGSGSGKGGVEVAKETSTSTALSGDSGPLAWAVSDAEVISVDSMQVYEGLDVITNKATEAERGGVRHHLMDMLPPGREYHVLDFVRDAKALITGMTSSDPPTLPILAGGTSYYTQHLLFPGRLVGTASDAPSDRPESSSADYAPGQLDDHGRAVLDELFGRLDPEQRRIWQLVDESTSAGPPPEGVEAHDLWSLLHALDPDMAKRWHWRDTRKVTGSLRVLLQTGRRHSEWIRAQRTAERERQGREASTSKPDTHSDGRDTDQEEAAMKRARKLILWVWCEPETLKSRLDRRVEKMVERGLLQEIRALRRIAAEAERAKASRGEDAVTDYTSGIYQAIGYKEFDAYLREEERQGRANDEKAESRHPHHPVDRTDESRRLFEQGLAQMQASTRYYAKKQTMWIRRQLIPTLLRANHESGLGEDAHIFLLDATDVPQWEDQVRKPALELVRAFLRGQPLPKPTSLPNLGSTARTYLRQVIEDAIGAFGGGGSGASDAQEADAMPQDDPLRSNALVQCDVCTSDPARPTQIRADQWRTHLQSRTHRNNLRKKGTGQGLRGRDSDEVIERKREERRRLKEPKEPQERRGEGEVVRTVEER